MEPHADPVQLPSPGEEVPHFLKEIINSCRAEDPDERPPAWYLLTLFEYHMASPELSDRDEPHDRASGDLGTRRPHSLLRLEDCLEKYDDITICDICDVRTIQHNFHCNTCASNDYDICYRCFSRGAHCLESDHYLRECQEGVDEVKYYSNVKATGQREIITL